ncbi:DUF2892 domain-containing protein [Haloferacaceae archaeon DSL9]
MEKNVGGVDRLIRAIFGPALIIVSVASFAGVLGIGVLPAVLALLVGLILSITAFTQRCPMNKMLGINTFRGARTDRAESMDEMKAQPR